MYRSVCHVPASPQIKEGKDEHPHQIDEVPVQAGDFDDLVMPLRLVKKPRLSTSKSPLNTFRAIAIRKITPIVTWVPWKPVIRKKHEPTAPRPRDCPRAGRPP